MKKIAYLFVLITIIACSSSSSEEPLLTGNSITSFQMEINGEAVSGQINQTNGTITLNVTDANLSSLAPTLLISEGATISPAANAPRNFSQEVQYTVTAEDGTRRIYTVIVNNRILSTENSITLFQLPINGETVNGEINQDDNTVTFNLAGADVSSLSPTITISDSASISPASNSTQNFNNNVSYTVTAENGDEKTYQVIVNNRPLNTESGILSFIVGINGEDIEARIDQDLKEIAFETGSFNITKLKPEITVSENATISPGSGEEVDFTEPVTYTVVAENGETTEYNVQINKAYEIQESTVIGFRSSGQLLYTRAKMRVITHFLDPNIPGVELFLFDGVNRTDLSIQDVQQWESNRTIGYTINTEIPENTVTSANYRLVYQLGNLRVESNMDIDILAEDSPKITGVNQSLYRPEDTLIITGENLTDLIGVPNNNGSFYIFNPEGHVTTSLNAEKTEYTVLMEDWSSFSYSAFFFYGGDTRDVIFLGPDRRVGDQVTINVEK